MASSILVIDDEPDLRQALAELLTTAGYQVETAADGADGIRVLQHRTFDLIITDILMPNRDGLEVIAAAKRLRSETPVLAMAQPNFPGGLDLLDLAKKLGAQGALPKPTRPDEVLQAVRGVLEACLRSKAAHR